jgi:hypothetical protein
VVDAGPIVNVSEVTT